jgi:hypothetical protein
VCFYDIDKEKRYGKWGFYMGGDNVFREAHISKARAWVKLEEETVEYARYPLNLTTLVCEVREENTPVQRLHEKMGFIKIDIKRAEDGEEAIRYQLILV